MSRWADLENAIAAKVATETAFATVQSAANAGVANIPVSGCPAATISVIAGKTIAHRAVMGAIYVTKHVEFQVLLSTRMATRAGESRLLTGGVWDLYDKLQAKLLGFIPRLSTPPVWIDVCMESDFFIDRLEPGAVDLDVRYSVDIELQNPAS